MSSSLSESIHPILERFDHAWNDATPPSIEDYLARANPDQRLTVLIELVRIDLERRLAAGEKVRLEETYSRQRFPELYADPSLLVTLVKHEYDLRCRQEPELMPAEYHQRFPQFQTDFLAQPTTPDDERNGTQQEMATIPLPSCEPAGLDLRGYELIETLGAGGMGEVYRCVDPALGRDLAIKVMMVDHRGHRERESRFCVKRASPVRCSIPALCRSTTWAG